jgi:nitric oxide reductase NorQ protein
VLQALDLGIVNKCFDDYERQLVEDMIHVRFPGDLQRSAIFAG